jgi:nucleoside recognition membrane protein YjiH
MLELQNTKQILALATVSTTAAATATSDAIDTLGFSELQVCILATTSNTVTNKFSVCKLQQSDTTENFADVTGYVGGTSFTVANANTSVSYLTLLNVDLKGKKRYFKSVVSPATTQSITVLATLGRSAIAPTSATAQGVNTVVNPS